MTYKLRCIIIQKITMNENSSSVVVYITISQSPYNSDHIISTNIYLVTLSKD